VNESLPEEKLTEIKNAVFSGQKIEAIRIYRELTNKGLAESKKDVEKIEATLRTTQPQLFKVPPRQGCLTTVLFVASLSGLTVWLILARF
jgi:hypothetical protein